MKFAIVGAGAIGGYLGAKLALAGEDVTFIARNRNLEAINAQGFKLINEDGSEQVTRNARAVQQMAEAGVQDVVLITLKAHQLCEVVNTLPALFGPDTLVVSMINGVPWWYFHKLGGEFDGRALSSLDPSGAIARAIAPERIIGSVVYPAAELQAPGVVKVVEGNRFTLGELDGSRSERISALSQVMMKAGFKAPVSKDIRSEIWVKLWGNLCFNPISALSHATLEDICRFPATRELAAAMMAEAQAVAERLGVQFKISIAQRIAGAEAVGAHKTSMLQDVERGRALELQALVGAVLELGQITGVATPHIAAIHAVTALLGHTLAQQQGRLEVTR
ncbi:MAG: 2-dehydropantoate 2-reductase [Burkholderiales bacterium]|nr:2-dehydropantoate 2-reductase [Burkholderiales bacterium]